MYAIAISGGKQYRIEKNGRIRVPTIEAAVGDTIRLEQILLTSDNGELQVGTPFVDGAYAQAKVVAHGRSSKVFTIKYKRRKGYHRKAGHRQDYTELLIDSIVLDGVKEAAAEAKVEKKAAAKKEEAVEKKPVATAEKAVEKAETKKAAPKKKAAEEKAPEVEEVKAEAQVEEKVEEKAEKKVEASEKNEKEEEKQD